MSELANASPAFCAGPVWDGPYQMVCDLALINGRCPRHGRRDAECRYCSQRVILGKHGWRLNVDDSSGYECPDAPHGYHGIDKEARSSEHPVPGRTPALRTDRGSRNGQDA